VSTLVFGLFRGGGIDVLLVLEVEVLSDDGFRQHWLIKYQ
jgi:hypothetical protein